jgi:hypothetical protein
MTPDFFIAGAPKCGTTALYTYLSDHPSICMSRPKEPNYFSTDLGHIGKLPVTSRFYENCFAHKCAGQITGEASPEYLFSQVAIRNIMAARPDAKFIVLLRNPVSAVISAHQNWLCVLREDITNLRDAWAAQDDRLAGLRIPASCPDPVLLQYRMIYSYAPQLERLMGCVPPSQYLILIYEEFFADQGASYARVLEFLGAPNDGRNNFPRVNEATQLRSARIAKLYILAPTWVRHVWHKIRETFGITFRAIRLFRWLNETPLVKHPIPDDLRQSIAAAFVEDISRCEKLLGRSLAIWREGNNG